MNEFEMYQELTEKYQELTEKLKRMGLELATTANGYSIIYNEALENIIAKLLNDFYSYEGYNLLLQHRNGEMCISIDTNDKGLSKVMLLNQIGDSLDRYVADIDYLASMNLELKSFYELFKESLEYEGHFGVGFINRPANKKYIIKTDMPQMKEVLQKAGFEFEGDKVIVSESEIERFYEILESMKDKEDDELLEDMPTEEEKKEGESVVDVYEKMLVTALGINMVVRLSIVKQSKEEGSAERLVNINYISKETGVLTDPVVFAYSDAKDFDNNVLPQLIWGFQQSTDLSGRKVEVNELNQTKCYLTSDNGGNDVILDGYYINEVSSLLDHNREHNLVNDGLDVQELIEGNVIEKPAGEKTFDRDVADFRNNSEELSETEEHYYLDGKRKTLSLGEMPTGTNNHGLSNSVSLALFLAIDVVAIFVGLFLLMH